MDAVRGSFSLLPDTEITAEANPSSVDLPFLTAAAKAGVNRLSFGVQSSREDELRLLGRTHTATEARETVLAARALGFQNISVDLMLGLPGSTLDTVAESLAFVLSLNPEHLSTYLLKIEPNTALSKMADRLSLPDGDAQAQQYLQVCEILEKNGFSHYEISNFAKEHRQSRHNNKYWLGAEYLGIGPSAHSFVDGKRFYYPRDLKAFCRRPETVPDGFGGDFEETVLLRLRLSSGIDFSATAERFGIKLPPELPKQLNHYAAAGLGVCHGTVFSLTDRGMLVSNQIISDILEVFS